MTVLHISVLYLSKYKFWHILTAYQYKTSEYNMMPVRLLQEDDDYACKPLGYILYLVFPEYQY